MTGRKTGTQISVFLPWGFHCCSEEDSCVHSTSLLLR